MADSVRINATVQDGETVHQFVIDEPTFDEAVCALIMKLWPDIGTTAERSARVLPSVGGGT